MSDDATAHPYTDKLDGPLIGQSRAEGAILAAIDRGAFTSGWILSGADGLGKASLALRIACAVLGPDGAGMAVPDSPGGDLLQDGGGPRAAMPLDARAGEGARRLILAGAHPDLFIARPLVNEKTGKQATEISVETIRRLSQFMSLTPSMGRMRLAVIDTADDLNRNAANALLKVLEEPPPNAALLLLSAMPGRLLATIRSRCRRIDLAPVEAEPLADFIKERTDLNPADAARIARAAKGRPGYALALAEGDGHAALDLVDQAFSAPRRSDAIAAALTKRGGEGIWPYFKEMLFDRLDGMIRARASAHDQVPDLEDDRAAHRAEADRLLAARDEIAQLIAASDGLNLDRAQTVHAIARRLAPALT